MVYIAFPSSDPSSASGMGVQVVEKDLTEVPGIAERDDCVVLDAGDRYPGLDHRHVPQGDRASSGGHVPADGRFQPKSHS